MTTEAIKMYLEKLRPDGVLIFNITNRYVKLAPVLADAAKQFDLVVPEAGRRLRLTDPRQVRLGLGHHVPPPQGAAKVGLRSGGGDLGDAAGDAVPRCRGRGLVRSPGWTIRAACRAGSTRGSGSVRAPAAGRRGRIRTRICCGR